MIKGYEPEALFRFFEDISAIPRGSGNEKGVSDMLLGFADARGLAAERDGAGNVFIRKPAAKGYEARPAVMLQGHMDMVCEKNGGTEHDFERDGLKLICEDGFLRADGTTLGGDDGIAVAMMMTLLDDKTLEAPALECLFTVEEETGLTGAENFDYSKVTAGSLINLDYEGEGVACVSCAGGEDTALAVECEEIPFQNCALSVKLLGLAGGHSGSDIDKNRASANILAGRLLSTLYAETPFNLISLKGGSKRNAIARECEAVISVFDAEKAKNTLIELEKELSGSLSADDANFRLHIGRAPSPERMFTFRSTSDVLDAILLSPHGICSMSAAKQGLVESSSNLGVICTEGNTVRLHFMSRSSVESSLRAIILRFDRLAKRVGAEAIHSAYYPGWAYCECALQQRYLDAYREITGREARLDAIHAGLECGIITSRIDGLRGKPFDCIAIGPDLFDIHSPSERMGLSSCERTYELVKKLLKDA